MAAKKKTTRKNGRKPGAKANGTKHPAAEATAVPAKRRLKLGPPEEGLEPVDLTADQVRERGKLLSQKVEQKNAIEAEKTSRNKEWNEKLRDLDSDIARLADEIDAEQEWTEPLLARMKQQDAATPGG